MTGLIDNVLKILTCALKSVKYVGKHSSVANWLIKAIFYERRDLLRKIFLRMKKFRIEPFPSSLRFMTTLSLDIFLQNENIKGMYMVVRPPTPEW